MSGLKGTNEAQGQGRILQPGGIAGAWPRSRWLDFGRTRPRGSGKRCKTLSASSQVSPHARWSRRGMKIPTDQKAAGLRPVSGASLGWHPSIMIAKLRLHGTGGGATCPLDRHAR